MDFQSSAASVAFRLLTVSSPYAYDQNVSYSFEIDISSVSALFKKSSTISLIFPETYPSFYSSEVSCSTNYILRCSVVADNKVVIGGYLKSMGSKLVVNLTGVTNPLSSNYTYSLVSY